MAVTFGETERSNVYCLQERMYVFLYIFTFIKYIVYKISNPTGWYHYLFQIYDACLEVKVSCQHINHYNGKLWQNEGILTYLGSLKIFSRRALLTCFSQ